MWCRFKTIQNWWHRTRRYFPRCENKPVWILDCHDAQQQRLSKPQACAAGTYWLIWIGMIHDNQRRQCRAIVGCFWSNSNQTSNQVVSRFCQYPKRQTYQDVFPLRRWLRGRTKLDYHEDRLADKGSDLLRQGSHVKYRLLARFQYSLLSLQWTWGHTNEALQDLLIRIYRSSSHDLSGSLDGSHWGERRALNVVSAFSYLLE